MWPMSLFMYHDLDRLAQPIRATNHGQLVVYDFVEVTKNHGVGTFTLLAGSDDDEGE